jgi:uracil-DNA glycosylase
MCLAREQQLQQLYQDLQKDRHYRNKRMGTIFVPGVGNPHSLVVLVGEAPGREEELQRLPFVGRAGGNLNALLDHVGWARDRLFITNLLKYRPLSETGGNRKPSLGESRYALGYLLRELTILDSLWVICLGSSAAVVLLGRPGLKMSHINGKVLPWDNRKLFVTYHPSPLNYNNPHRRRELFKSFDYLKRAMPFV